MKKRIMFLESRYDSFYGAQKSMLKLIQSLDNSSFDCKIVTTGIGHFKREIEKNNFNVDVVRLGKKANVFGGKALDYSILSKLIVLLQIVIYNFKIINYVFKNKIDIIYSNDIRALLYSVLASKILRKKSIWYIRSDVLNNKMTDLALKFSDNIITIAHGVLRELPSDKREKYKHKITNIYTGFDFSEYIISNKNLAKRKIEISDHKLVIGYLGSINKRKGLDNLVDAYANIYSNNSNVELLIVGDVSPGYEDFWNEQKNKLDEKGIKFKHLSFCNQVSKVYSAMDIFVLPSQSEGLPRVVIEAMAHKIPVIATNVGGTREIIDNNRNGLLIEKDCVSDLTSSLEYLIKNPEVRERLSDKALIDIKAKFNIKSFTESINNYFQRF